LVYCLPYPDDTLKTFANWRSIGKVHLMDRVVCLRSIDIVQHLVPVERVRLYIL